VPLPEARWWAGERRNHLPTQTRVDELSLRPEGPAMAVNIPFQGSLGGFTRSRRSHEQLPLRHDGPARTNHPNQRGRTSSTSQASGCRRKIGCGTLLTMETSHKGMSTRVRRSINLSRRLVSLGICAIVGAALLVGVSPTRALASTIGGQVTRDEIVARGNYWVSTVGPNTYCANSETYCAGPNVNRPWLWDLDHSRTYRPDCSGFVAMALHLGGTPPSTSDYVTYDANSQPKLTYDATRFTLLGQGSGKVVRSTHPIETGLRPNSFSGLV
jgi:hypothetical protein